MPLVAHSGRQSAHVGVLCVPVQPQPLPLSPAAVHPRAPLCIPRVLPVQPPFLSPPPIHGLETSWCTGDHQWPNRPPPNSPPLRPIKEPPRTLSRKQHLTLPPPRAPLPFCCGMARLCPVSAVDVTVGPWTTASTTPNHPSIKTVDEPDRKSVV